MTQFSDNSYSQYILSTPRHSETEQVIQNDAQSSFSFSQWRVLEVLKTN